MSKRIYSSRDLSRYLLGALPEADVESFDELSFIDEEFADALSAVERDLVDAYVQGELEDPELERFKSHYLASPLRREKVLFAQAFKVLSDRATATPVEVESRTRSLAKRKDSGWFSSLSALATGQPALQWGFAAAVLVLIVACGWLVFENARLRQQAIQAQASRDDLLRHQQELQDQIARLQSAGPATEQELARLRDEQKRLEQELAKQQENAGEQHQPSSGVLSVATFILAPPLRGTVQIQTFTIPPKTGLVAMQLGLEPNDYAAYRVALGYQSSNQTLWRSSKLKAKVASSGKIISVSFRAALLKPQAYVLRVSGISAKGTAEIVGNYPFRVVKSK